MKKREVPPLHSLINSSHRAYSPQPSNPDSTHSNPTHLHFPTSSSPQTISQKHASTGARRISNRFRVASQIQPPNSLSPQHNVNPNPPSSMSNASTNGHLSPQNHQNKDSLRPVSVSKMGGNSSNLSEYFSASSSSSSSHTKTNNNNLPSWVKKDREHDEQDDDHIPPSHYEPQLGTGYVKAAVLASGSKPRSNTMSGKSVDMTVMTDNNDTTNAPAATKNVVLSQSSKTAATAATEVDSSPYVPVSMQSRVMREEASSSSVARPENIRKFDQESSHPAQSYHNNDNSEEGGGVFPHHSNTAESSPTIVKQRPSYASYTSGQ